jgi:hypothetical protein
MYQLTDNATVIRISDGAFIPNDEANNDYAEYLEWIADGNTPQPYVAPIPTWQELRQAEYSKVNWTELQLNDVMNGTTTAVDAYAAIRLAIPKA